MSTSEPFLPFTADQAADDGETPEQPQDLGPEDETGPDVLAGGEPGGEETPVWKGDTPFQTPTGEKAEPAAD